MSVQIHQYLIYGIKTNTKFIHEWEEKNGKDFHDEFDDFMHDSAFKREIVEKDGIFCLYDGMSGRYLIIGKVYQKGTDDEPFIADDEPYSFDEPSESEKQKIADSIERNFGLKGDMKMWLVTRYR